MENEVSFWGNKNSVKLIGVIVTHLCDYIQTHWAVFPEKGEQHDIWILAQKRCYQPLQKKENHRSKLGDGLC